jgi:hypothetical protein
MVPGLRRGRDASVNGAFFGEDMPSHHFHSTKILRLGNVEINLDMKRRRRCDMLHPRQDSEKALTSLGVKLCHTKEKQRQQYPWGRAGFLHCDQGSQFTSVDFRKTLARYDAVQSMSVTGRCYGNARTESFLATLKKENFYQIQAEKMPMAQVKSVPLHRDLLQPGARPPGAWLPNPFILGVHFLHRT